MPDELIIFGTTFPSIENDNKDYVPVWKQKVNNKFQIRYLTFITTRPFLQKEQSDSMVHSRADFRQVISILWVQKKDGNRRNSFQVVKTNTITMIKLKKITWTRKIMS